MALLAATTCALVAFPSFAVPEFGILQFKVEHNLESPGCLAAGNCFLGFEAFEDPEPWLAELAAHSNLAVLHWDSGIPWLVFDVDPPVGVDRVAYYDTTLDSATVAWINAFEAHFESMGRGYLAVSILSGERDRLAPLQLGLGNNISFSATCPDFAPGSQIVVDPGSGATSFDLERSYRNFLLYLAEKLTPDYFALMVEANLIETKCPARADGLYALYRSLHDQVQAEFGRSPLLFATLVYPQLLDYDRTRCYPTSSFVASGTPPGPPFPSAGVDACYPVNSNAIDALDLGGRLDVLALSFYPDSLEMNPLRGELAETRAYLLDDWNNGGSAAASLYWPDPVDPMAALGRLGWTGPVAIAETSARSCTTPLRFDVTLPGTTTPTPFVFEAAGSPASQAAWVGQTYQAAIDGDYLFYLHSFLRDDPPAGTWTVESGILPPETQALFNIWPCSGIQDANGQPKPEMAALGLPEPSTAHSLVAGFCLISGLSRMSGRRRSRGLSRWR